jgi:hypothetical protein
MVCMRPALKPWRGKVGVDDAVPLEIQIIQGVHQVVEVVFGLFGLAFLTLGDADGHADGVAADCHQLDVALEDRLL